MHQSTTVALRIKYKKSFVTTHLAIKKEKTKMKLFCTTLTIALIAMANAGQYGAGPAGYQLQGTSSSADTASGGGASAGANTPDANAFSGAVPSSYGNSRNIPYSPANTRGNSVTSSISYPNNKGEILIHRPAAIIVKRPPTKVLVNHPPLVVKPAPVVLHKPPAVVVRKVFVKHHPRPVKVEPVYVNVVKPPAEKYFVNEKQQHYNTPQAQYGAVNLAPSVPSSYDSAPSSSASSSSASTGLAAVDSAATNAGYQLLPGGNSGLGSYAGVAGQGSYGNPSSYAAPGGYAAPGSYAAPGYGAQAPY